MLIANSREEVEARINALGMRAEKSLQGVKKSLKTLSKNELINVLVAVVGYGAIYDNENINNVVIRENEVQAFLSLRGIEMDKINMIIETLTLEAMSKQGDSNDVQEEQQPTEA